jgi:hypothetical protein
MNWLINSTGRDMLALRDEHRANEREEEYLERQRQYEIDEAIRQLQES